MSSQEQELAVWEPNPQEMDIYRRHFAPPSTTDTEWEIFLEVCRTYRVSPLRKQIYLIGRWDNAKKRMINTPQISIGGLRGMALDTGQFEGTTEPQWGDEEGNWYSLWPKRLGTHPYAARIGVYRRGFRAPVWGVAYFDEMAQTTGKGDDKRLTQFWETKGRLMILKCAEAAGLRAAFEERCGGLYIHEEMNQADAEAMSITIIPEVGSSENEALQDTAKHVSSVPTLDDLKKLCDEVMGSGKWASVRARIIKAEEVGDIPDELLGAAHLTQIHTALLDRKKKKAALQQKAS